MRCHPDVHLCIWMMRVFCVFSELAAKLVNLLKTVEKSLPMIAEITILMVETYENSHFFTEVLRLIKSFD